MTIPELRLIAEKATPGPWTKDLPGWEGWTVSAEHLNGGTVLCSMNPNFKDMALVNSAHIATFSPSRVLKILEDYEKMKAALEWYGDENKNYFEGMAGHPENADAWEENESCPYDKTPYRHAARWDIDWGNRARDCLASLSLTSGGASGKEGG